MLSIRRLVPILTLGVVLSACAGNPPIDDGAQIKGLMPTPGEIATDAERKGDWALAARNWHAALGADPNNREIALSLGRSLRLSGSCGPAIGILGGVLAKNAADTEALLESAKCQLVSGRPEAAEQQLLDTIAGAPESWEAETALGVTLDRLGRHAEAQAHHDRAVELVPDKPIVLSNKALSLALFGRLPEALTLMRRAASMPTAPMRVRMNLAMLEAVSGHDDRAVTIASQETLADKGESLAILKKIAEAAAKPARAK